MEEGKGMKQAPNGSARRVLQLPGEPDEVPEMLPKGNINGNMDLGEWYLGRYVRIVFKGRYHLGKVIGYAKDSGWYKVQYEDGDTEDLYWEELKEILHPLEKSQQP